MNQEPETEGRPMGSRRAISAALIGVMLTAVLASLVYLDLQGPAETDGTTEEIHVTASRYQFSPGDITVKAGTKIVFHLTTADVNHGFAIRGTSVNEQIVPGSETIATLIATDPGVYEIFCTVFCGTGHPQHRGKLIVEA